MHLVKHIGHFPMASGAAQMNSIVTELNDQYSDVTDDVDRQHQLIAADNVQVIITVWCGRRVRPTLYAPTRL